MVWRRFKLNPEERSLIHQVMVEQGMNQSKLGKIIGIDSAQASHKLGKCDISLTPEEAQLIYAQLGEDERLLFLKRDFSPDPRLKYWKELFMGYVRPLQQVYTNQSPNMRASILEDLEGLVTKYSTSIQKETASEVNST